MVEGSRTYEIVMELVVKGTDDLKKLSTATTKYMQKSNTFQTMQKNRVLNKPYKMLKKSHDTYVDIKNKKKSIDREIFFNRRSMQILQTGRRSAQKALIDDQVKRSEIISAENTIQEGLRENVIEGMKKYDLAMKQEDDAIVDHIKNVKLLAKSTAEMDAIIQRATSKEEGFEGLIDRKELARSMKSAEYEQAEAGIITGRSGISKYKTEAADLRQTARDTKIQLELDKKALSASVARTRSLVVESSELQKTSRAKIQAIRMDMEIEKERGKELNTSKNRQKGFWGVMGMGLQEWKEHNKEMEKNQPGVDAFDNSMGGIANSIRKGTHSLKGFKMEMLGIMFFGMNLAKTLGASSKSVRDLLGISEYASMQLDLMTLDVMLPHLDTIYDTIDGLIEGMGPAGQSMFGHLTIAADVFGNTMSFLGSTMLGLGSMIQVFGGVAGFLGSGLGDIFRSAFSAIGITGTMFDTLLGSLAFGEGGALNPVGGTVFTTIKAKLGPSFAKFFDPMGKWIIETAKHSVDFISELTGTISKFFSPVGEWIMQKKDFTMNFLSNIAGTISKFFSPIGEWIMEKKDTLISLGVTYFDKAKEFFLEKGGWALENVTSTVKLAMDTASKATLATLEWLKTEPVTSLLVNVSVALAGLLIGYELAKWLDEIFTQPLIKMLEDNLPGYKGWRDNNLDNAPHARGEFTDFITHPLDAYGYYITSTYGSLFSSLDGLLNAMVEAGYMTSGDIDTGRFASGGIVTRPTLALIGEAGPEAVVPLNGNSGGYGATQIYNNVYINADVSNNVDMQELAERVNAELQWDYRRSTMR